MDSGFALLYRTRTSRLESVLASPKKVEKRMTAATVATVARDGVFVMALRMSIKGNLATQRKAAKGKPP
jgi:hypothetical protein